MYPETAYEVTIQPRPADYPAYLPARPRSRRWASSPRPRAAGESIKALAEYLGRSDPGLTLKVYAHLMPSSRDRARKALGRALRPQDPGA
ncbi:hypothetical protein [Streptomyces sp. DT203]|uniref:hypothetical protein n=1 Tax=Streptomyces sp. DT203 TaxID=3393424 RepID=UPI003CF008BE